MGAWGVDPFQNDLALDWLGEFTDDFGIDFVRATLDQASWENGEVTLAAAEIVAAIAGHAGSTTALDRPVGGSVASRLPALRPALTSELVRSSIAAVDGVANDSELADLWRDSADETEWRALLEDLKARLEAAL
jgi:hypothetical protein